jgi:hypothetical protein
MTGKNEILNFQKMWTWLYGYPAHDRDYYMKHVAKLDEHWVNSCPLCNSSEVKDCDGCEMLWKSERGSLCTDSGSPLYKWQNTGTEYPDDRCYYASQTAVLAMKFLQGHSR